MDTLRGTFDNGNRADDSSDWANGQDDTGPEDETVRELPPEAIGQDERRMQVRAYNHWASLLDEATFPSIEDLEPHNLDDFGPNSVVLDFSAGIDDPVVQFLGDRLAEECGSSRTGEQIQRLSDVPPRSLLSRITDHYMQIIANQAPIGFEAEFVNQRGAAILYRGILLPFSSDDETIDFIYGVINWKEMADAATADELLLEIDQALSDHREDDEIIGDSHNIEEIAGGDVATDRVGSDSIDARGESFAQDAIDEADLPHKHHRDPVTQWTDSPLEEMDNSPVDAAYAEMTEHREADMNDAEQHDNITNLKSGADRNPSGLGQIGFGQNGLAAQHAEDQGDEDLHDDLPMPDFGQYHLDEPEVDEFGDEILDEEDAESGGYSFASLADYIEAPSKKAVDLDAEQFDPDDYQVDHTDMPFEQPDAVEPEQFEEQDIPQPAPVASEPPANSQTVAMETQFETEPAFTPRPADAEEEGRAQYAAAMASPGKGAHIDDNVDMDKNAGLHDCLAAARELAQSARVSEDRSRQALYQAVGRAYDFSIVADAEPDAYHELIEESGLSVQDRAPMTPIVKLVFGADYDKTRLTEYAAVLSHAHRVGVERGRLGHFLRNADGGLKGVVAAERRLRREESGKEVEAEGDIRAQLARKLRELDEILLDQLDRDGPEFSLVMVRRDGAGNLALIGEIADDVALIERAGKRLVG